jgi:hypothetical protein
LAVSLIPALRRGKNLPLAVSVIPSRRTLKLLLNVALLGLICLSFVTGWIASLLGLTEFGLHKWSSMAFVVIATAHLGLHWRALAAQAHRLHG